MFLGQYMISLKILANFWFRRFLPSFGDFLLLVTGLTLRASVKAFISSLKTEMGFEMSGRFVDSDPEEIEDENEVIGQVISMDIASEENGRKGSGSSKWSRVQKLFHKLKILSNRLNSVFGAAFTWFMLEAIVYYATSFHKFFVLLYQDWVLFSAVIFYFVCALITLLTAAGVCSDVNEIELTNDINLNINIIPTKRLNLDLNVRCKH